MFSIPVEWGAGESNVGDILADNVTLVGRQPQVLAEGDTPWPAVFNVIFN
jgi:hypothetical protein